MAVLTGRSGQFYVDGARVARCAGWELEESRPMLESTTVDSWDRTFLPGRIEGTGNAQLLYDPNDAAAVAFFESIFTAPTGTEEIAVEAVLDDATGVSYPLAVLVSSVSHAVSKGEAQMRSVAFRLSDVGLELEIVGNARALQGTTSLYTGNVFGLSGAWTYLWTIAGPTISDPTSQTTNITFDTLGSYTLTLTATLGATVLTQTLEIEVISFPLMWISRPNYLMDSVGWTLSGAAHMDKANQEVYWVTPTWPDVSVEAPSTSLAKFDYQGNPLLRRSITGLDINPAGSVYETPSAIQALSDGSLFLAFNRFSGVHHMRLTPDLSTITWRNKYSGFWRYEGGCYDPTTDRMFFFSEGGPSVGYIDLATGNVTRVTVTTSPTTALTQCKAIRLANGRILFIFNSNDNIVLMECNNDLRVGGVFQPIRTIQHQFTVLGGSGITVLETDNYIAAVHSGANAISLFDKDDYTHVRTRTFSIGTSIFDAYYAGGEFVISIASGVGWKVYKLNEGLTLQTGQVLIYGSTATSAPYAPNAPGIQSFRSNLHPGNIGGNYDEVLGLTALHAGQRNAALTTAEILIVHRASYTTSNVLDYGAYRMAISPETPAELGNTLLTLTATNPRTYTFASVTNATASASVTIAADTKSYLQYVLA
jgi:hypothetical protein